MIKNVNVHLYFWFKFDLLLFALINIITTGLHFNQHSLNDCSPTELLWVRETVVTLSFIFPIVYNGGKAACFVVVGETYPRTGMRHVDLREARLWVQSNAKVSTPPSPTSQFLNTFLRLSLSISMRISPCHIMQRHFDKQFYR